MIVLPLNSLSEMHMYIERTLSLLFMAHSNPFKIEDKGKNEMK